MNLNSFSLKNRTAIVTGCSSGLGQAMAIGLAEAGANIIGINRSSADETASKVEAHGQTFTNINGDMSNIAGLDEIVKECKSVAGTIDILVNNAGIIRRNDIFEFSEKDWDDVMDVNLKAVFFMSQKIGKVFKDQGSGGKIINVASMLSFQGGIKVPSYTSSKSGVMGLTRLLSNELAEFNINVNAIAPGYIETKATKALRDDEKRSKEVINRIPAGRWGKPGDLGGIAVFLSSAASEYINGYTIAVDGGWLAR